MAIDVKRREARRFILSLSIAFLASDCKSTNEERSEARSITPEESAVATGIIEGDLFREPIAVRYTIDRQGYAIYGGDMILAAPGEDLPPSVPQDGFLSLFGVGVARQANLWPRGIIPYEFDDKLSATRKDAILRAMKEREAKTPIRFTPRRGEAAYVRIVFDEESSSCGVGYNGGRQTLRLATDRIDTARHELGHLIGLKHEFVRSDRDKFLTVHLDNIEPESRHNFDIIRSSMYQDYGAALDMDSVMMYSSYGFSTNGDPTLTTKDGDTFVDSPVMSEGDYRTVNIMYGGVAGPAVVARRRPGQKVCATLFADPAGEGANLWIEPGVAYDFNKTRTEWNDTISSLALNRDCSIDVYSAWNFGIHNQTAQELGDMATFDFSTQYRVRDINGPANLIDFSSGALEMWDDRISSIRCRCQ